MESIGLKCIQLFPSHSQLKIVLIDVIHKKQNKKTAFEGGVVMRVECKVTGQSAQNYLLTSGISYQDPSWRAEMHVLSPVCFAKYCIFILHASYPLQRLWTECCKSGRQKTLRTAQRMWSQGSATHICDLLQTRLPNVLAFPFTTQEISTSAFFPSLSLLFT